MLHVGLPDRHLEHGTREQCLKDAGLDVAGILDAIAAYTATLELRPARRRTLSLRNSTMFNGLTRMLTRGQFR